MLTNMRLFVKHADEAVRIGGKQPNESYLVIDKIIDAAKQTVPMLFILVMVF
jgi:acetyl/propionyl-CoA carboxylase alpha subunit